MKRTLTLLIFFLSSLFATACMNTFQFKVFPVGVLGDQIVSVDVILKRTSQIEGCNWLALDCPDADEFKGMWIMQTYIGIYDREQQLQKLTPVDTLHSFQEYTEVLSEGYEHAYQQIVNKHPEIERFEPLSLTNCDHVKDCGYYSVRYDSLSGKDFLVMGQKIYPLPIVQDSAYYGFGNSYYYRGNTLAQSIGSVRVFRNSSMTLVLAHLQTGQNYNSMRADQSSPPPPPPVLTFDKKHKAIYNEPLLHHGFGFDVFAIK